MTKEVVEPEEKYSEEERSERVVRKCWENICKNTFYMEERR
jgi:hypothetical protein